MVSDKYAFFSFVLSCDVNDPRDDDGRVMLISQFHHSVFNMEFKQRPSQHIRVWFDNFLLRVSSHFNELDRTYSPRTYMEQCK